MFDDTIDTKKQEMLDALSEVIRFPSISEESSDPSMPFGKACKDALQYVLNLGEKLGFRTKNVDNYCGYIEFGEGEELVGILGHLDVVPADSTWTYSPFSPTIANGKLYGRGAIDDKGPVIASLYAMKAVMDSSSVKKRVRLILGLNEEKSWKCMNYYAEHEEHPSVGFSPDADFPCIYAEKGLLTVYLKQLYNSYQDIRIVGLDCEKNAINVVPKYCNVLLEVGPAINIDELIARTQWLIAEYQFNIEVSRIDDSHIQLISHGVSAHAAHPDLGVNAVSRMLLVLHDIFDQYHESLPILDIFYEKMKLEYSGESLGIGCQDESGSLTLNVANLEFYENDIQIGMNLRIPVTADIASTKTVFQNLADTFDNIFVYFCGEKAPLFYSKETPLVQTLCSIFQEYTGLSSEPIAIGGATYARAFPNVVSSGANMPGHEDMCHQADEYIGVEDLMLSAKIYASAIYRLAN